MSFTIKVKRTTHVDLSKVQLSLRGPKKVKVGLVAGEADSDNIMKGIWNEFGTRDRVAVTTASRSFVGPTIIGPSAGNTVAEIGGIPERPFLRSAMRDNKGKYRDGMKASARKLLLGQTSLQTVLSKLGIMAKSDVDESISTWTTPGNSEVTIAIKGSSHPLIDTGEMKRSVSYKVGDF